MKKIIKWSLLAFGLLSILLWFLLSGVDNPNDEPYSGIMLVIAYILLIFVVLAIVVYGIKGLISHPKRLKKTAILTGSSLIVIMICYSLSSGETSKSGVPASHVEFVETGLYLFYILTVLALGLMLGFGIKKVLKK